MTKKLFFVNCKNRGSLRYNKNYINCTLNLELIKNVAVSGGLNIKAYELLIKKAPNVEGQMWTNHEEFFAQMIADAVGEVLSYYYLVPLFGLNQTDVITEFVFTNEIKTVPVLNSRRPNYINLRSTLVKITVKL